MFRGRGSHGRGANATEPTGSRYLSRDFFVVLAATFRGPPCLDFPDPWPDAPFPAFGLG